MQLAHGYLFLQVGSWSSVPCFFYLPRNLSRSGSNILHKQVGYIHNSLASWFDLPLFTVLLNLGATFGFFPCLAVVSHWFRRRLAFAVGFVGAGASVGGVVFPIMLQRLLPRLGFGWSVRIVAFLVLFCYSIAILTIRRRRPTKQIPPITELLDFGAFRDPCFLFLAIGSWFSIFSIFNPFFYVALYGSVAFGTSNLTAYAVAIMCATSVVGRILPGFIADRVGRSVNERSVFFPADNS
jgi:nitrate/nitrite transporter NarK